MEIIALIAAIIGIITGLWFLWDKFHIKRSNSQSFSYLEGSQKFPVIRRIDFPRTPLLCVNESLYLNKVSVFLGNNGVGKTAICEWLSGLEGIKYLERWLNLSKSEPIILKLEIRDPEKHNLSLKLSNSSLTFNFDGNDIPESPYPFRIILASRKKFSTEGMDDADILAKHLNMDKATLQNYGTRVGSSFYCSISKIQFKDENSKTNVYVDMEGTSPNLRFGSLSGSEKGRVILELAVAIAQFLSSTIPVILIIERDNFNLDKGSATKYVDWIISSNFKFQTIIVSCPRNNDVDWSKCEVVNFDGKPPNVKIQNKNNRMQKKSNQANSTDAKSRAAD